MGEELQSYHHHSSMPLVSRVDRLDSLMRYIEGKEEIGKLRSSHNNITSASSSSSTSSSILVGTKDLEVAMNEAHSNGSLMDRILSLEDRLVRLCLEIESNKTSPTPTMQTSFGPSSTKVFKRVPISSYPIFNKPQLHINGYDEFQKKPNKMQQNGNDNQGPMKQQVGENKVHEKTCKSGKRRNISWPHLKILGC